MLAALLGPACAFGSSVTWAVGTGAYSRLSRRHSAFAVNFTRAAIGLPLFVVATFVLAGGWSAGLAAYGEVSWRHWAWYSAGMVASYGLADALFLMSTASLGVPGALAIASCYPVWTALVGVLFEGEHLVVAQVAGLGLVVAGIVLVVLNGPVEAGLSEASDVVPEPRDRSRGDRHAFQHGDRRIGIGLLLAGATSLLWAGNSYVCAHAGAQLVPSVGNTLRMLLALGFAPVFGLMLAPGSRVSVPVADLRGVWWIFAFEVFGGSMCFLYGLSHSPLAIGSTLSALAPVISVPVAWVMRLERFSFARTSGVVLTVAGLSLLLLAR
jgi:drug/metabolite transporter (DMT)-like permease